MERYEEGIAKQPSGAFNRKERQTLRSVSEHWVDDQRYSAERRRRVATYFGWVGLGVPVLLGAIKVVEALWK